METMINLRLLHRSILIPALLAGAFTIDYFVKPAEADNAPKALTHTILPGDTLWRISRHYGIPLVQLMECNRLVSDKIMAGEELIIPPPSIYKECPDNTWQSFEDEQWQSNLKYAPLMDNAGSKNWENGKTFFFDGTGAVRLGKYNGPYAASPAHLSNVMPQAKRFIWALAQYARDNGLGNLAFQTNAGPNHTRNNTDHVNGTGVDIFLLGESGDVKAFDPDDSNSKSAYDALLKWVLDNKGKYRIRMTVGYKGNAQTDYNNRAHDSHLHVSLNK